MKTTIVLPISRDTFLQRVFPSLEFLICDKENTNLLVLVDGNQRLYEKARNYVVSSKCKQRLCVFSNKGEVNPTSIKERRQRISDIHNQMKMLLVETDYVFSTEDDTLLHPTSLYRLQKVYSDFPYAGLVTGVQVGRWGLKYAGLWEVDKIYEPTKIKSTALKQGVHKVDASGLYCLLTKKENYVKHTFEPFEDVLGPDFNYGIQLRRQGLENYCNYDVHCTHLTPKEDIKVSNISLISYEKQHDKWWQII